MIRNIEQIVQSLADSQTPSWFRDLRAQGFTRFTKAGIPTLKDEAWKYTDLKALNKHSFDMTQEDTLIAPDDIDKLKGTDGIDIVLVNGILSNELYRFRLCL